MKIEKNSTVLIRPNANTADYPPGSTNPEVLKGAIRAVKEYNPAKIFFPCHNFYNTPIPSRYFIRMLHKLNY